MADQGEAVRSSATREWTIDPSRLGSTTGSLTVSYTLSGTAINGTDYQTVSGSAIIPAGALGVDVPIRPVNDALAEGTETIILTLAPGPYGRGVPARLYLSDDESPSSVNPG